MNFPNCLIPRLDRIGKCASLGHKFAFAIEDTNNGANIGNVKYDLKRHKDYWAIAWMDNNREVVSISETKPSNESEVLYIGSNGIDLCQQGDFGQSYLVNVYHLRS
jgi:hypothetical protein